MGDCIIRIIFRDRYTFLRSTVAVAVAVAVAVVVVEAVAVASKWMERVEI